jgi:hypothetical protein
VDEEEYVCASCAVYEWPWDSNKIADDIIWITGDELSWDFTEVYASGTVGFPVMHILSPDTEYTVYFAAESFGEDGWETSIVVAVTFRTEIGTPVCEIVETNAQYTTLKAALAAVTNGQTIKLTDNYG